ncbi:MAG: hypothetical protein AAGD96_04405 [Chloroflexota bacterium]
MQTATVALALEDFVPVILSSIGFLLLGRMLHDVDHRLGRMALFGWALLTLGGLLKAVEKLIHALMGKQESLIWLDKGLFIWLAAGFVLVATALYFAKRDYFLHKPQSWAWLWPVVILGASVFAMLQTGFPDPNVNTWRFVLLGVMTVANIALIVWLVQWARAYSLNSTGWLFIITIVAVFLLSGLARIPNPSVAVQWIDQLTNTAGQAAFLVASIQLGRAYYTAEAPGLNVSSTKRQLTN